MASFFGIENERIAADKTTVTIYPKTQEIEILIKSKTTLELEINQLNNEISSLNKINSKISSKDKY